MSNNWKDLGSFQDDPEISTLYQTDSEASKDIRSNGFGAKGTYLKYIKKNKAKVGFKRTYECDNKTKSDCKKVLRIVHYYAARNNQG